MIKLAMPIFVSGAPSDGDICLIDERKTKWHAEHNISWTQAITVNAGVLLIDGLNRMIRIAVKTEYSMLLILCQF
jgi:hypothetical protein